MSSSELIFRLAKTTDREGVLDINRNVYSGFDYVPSLFFCFQHHPDVMMFVAEIVDKIVSTRMIQSTSTIRCYVHVGYVRKRDVISVKVNLKAICFLTRKHNIHKNPTLWMYCSLCSAAFCSVDYRLATAVSFWLNNERWLCRLLCACIQTSRDVAS